MVATEARAVNCPQWAARGARGVVKWRARAAIWYGLMPAAPLLGRVSAPRTAHRERIGAIEHGGNRRGCEAPLCVPFLLLHQFRQWQCHCHWHWHCPVTAKISIASL